MFRRALAVCLLVVSLGQTEGRSDDVFERDVAPILQKHCVDCHGDDEPEAKLRLNSVEGLLYGSQSGRVVVPGDAAASMIAGLLAADSKPHMPPEGQLTADEIARIGRWIEELSPESLPKRDAVGSREHWAYRPLADVVPPTVRNANWIRDPLDRFVLAKLEAAGLEPSPEADPVTLCRRLYFDLIGLPPTPAEVEEFVGAISSAPSQSDADYARLVEKLLASPHYGERWGRHWLDLARYADSGGFHEDIDRPNAWKYRDYVIAAFNDDKPYAQFIAEQIAGDELAPTDPASWIATGFCRCGPSNDSNMGEGSAREKYRLDLLDDVVSTTSAVFLGQTIGCARCHDHKLDPISQTEYYRFLAFFDSTERVEMALDEQGSPVKPLRSPEKKEGDKKPAHRGAIMALTDAGPKPRSTHVLWRGDVLNRGPAVGPGVPEALTSEPLTIPTSSLDAKTTGRRRALADWIASPRNPLTWRVAVNRIWQHHFGLGIVATPSNFGSSGAPPTHSELLDYLAGEMIAADGSWKAMHRRIVLSAAYRQASIAPAELTKRATQVDPENRLLWHARTRRLEAEVLRDSILAAAGTLNRRVGGPGVKPRIRPELLVASQRNKWPLVEREGPEHWRRSVYIYVKRQLPFPMLELFDQPNSAQTCERRDENVIATQALVLMNDEFVEQQAAHFADRVIAEVGGDFERQAAWAIQIALARSAEPEEIVETTEFMCRRSTEYRVEKRAAADAARAALVDFCQVLLNSNEFAYTD